VFGSKHHRLGLGLGVGLSVASLSASAGARANDRVCDGARIHVAGDVQPRWRAAIDGACSAMATIAGVDPTAHVRMAAIERDLVLEVTLADGRFASRRVVSPDALLATLEALVVVPPSGASELNEVRAVSEASESSAASADDGDHGERAQAPSAIGSTWPRLEEPAPSPRPSDGEPTTAIELGGGAGGRVAAHGYLSASVAGFADIRVGDWLLGTLIRWDVIGSKSAPLVDVFEMETVIVGIAVARRVGLGFGSLDAGLSPRLAVETQTFESGAAGESSLSSTDVRLGAFARLSFGKSALRPVVELDADVSPSRLRRVVQLDPRLPALPSWSAGLSAGLAWTAP
jgi:hypothetical protein